MIEISATIGVLSIFGCIGITLIQMSVGHAQAFRRWWLQNHHNNELN